MVLGRTLHTTPVQNKADEDETRTLLNQIICLLTIMVKQLDHIGDTEFAAEIGEEND